jgi:hypothetical protein
MVKALMLVKTWTWRSPRHRVRGRSPPPVARHAWIDFPDDPDTLLIRDQMAVALTQAGFRYACG